MASGSAPTADYTLSETAVSVDWIAGSSTVLALGQIDGALRLVAVDQDTDRRTTLRQLHRRRLRSAVRCVRSTPCGRRVLTAGANRSLCVWDAQTAGRVRCVVRAADAKPSAMTALDPAHMGVTVALGDEDGTVALWDMRAHMPKICTFKHGRQQDDIGDLSPCPSAKSTAVLVSASVDGTLCAYDTRARQLLMRSEGMHDALNSMAVANGGRVYAASGDGFVEVFNRGEWGNLVERIQCGPADGIDCIRKLRENMLVCSSYAESRLRFVQLSPSTRLGSVRWRPADHCLPGVAELAVSGDGTSMAAVCLDGTVKLWSVDGLVDSLSAGDKPAGETARRKGNKRRRATSTKRADERDSKLAFFSDLAPANASDEEEGSP